MNSKIYRVKAYFCKIFFIMAKKSHTEKREKLVLDTRIL